MQRKRGKQGAWKWIMDIEDVLHSSTCLQGQVVPLLSGGQNARQSCTVLCSEWSLHFTKKTHSKSRHLPWRRGPLFHSLNWFPSSSHFRGKECPSLHPSYSFFCLTANSLSILEKRKFCFVFFPFLKLPLSLPVCFDNQLALQRMTF